MDFAPVLMEGLTPKMEIIAETELGETLLVKKESLKKIKELIEREQDFQPFIDDDFLFMFLRYKKHDVEKAYESLKNFYHFKEKNSRVLTDFLPSEHKTIMDSNSFTVLLSRDSNGCAVVVVRLGQFNWSEATVEDLFATTFTSANLLARLEASSVCGCVIVIDLKDFSMKMVFKFLSIRLWIFLIKCLHNCFPLRIKAIHIVNEPVLYHAIVSLFKLATPKKLRERYFLHGYNIESLHKYIPVEILPEELGGKAGPIDNTELFDFALRHESLVEEMNKCGFKK